MIARAHSLWTFVFVAWAATGCQGDAPHLSVHSLLAFDAYQVELDGDGVVDELVPEEPTIFVEVAEGDGPLWLDLDYVGINGDPSPQAFEVSDWLGYRSAFDCWVLYLEPCAEEPGGVCIAAQRTVYDGLLRGCVDEPL